MPITLKLLLALATGRFVGLVLTSGMQHRHVAEMILDTLLALVIITAVAIYVPAV
jgi:hypothetical protein